MQEILNIIHKTIYQFFDVCEDNEEVPMSDKDKLLLEVNKAICNNLKAFNVPDTNVGELISRQVVIDTIETDCSWDIFNEWGSRTPTGECIINAIKSVPSVETESCGDCISRQAVLEKAINIPIAKIVTDDKVICCKVVFVDDIEKLPPVIPQPKTGKWIEHEWAEEENGLLIPNWECSLCKMWERKASDFCPNCGAKMEVDA